MPATCACLCVRIFCVRAHASREGGREGKTYAALLHGDQAPGDHLGGADFFDVIESAIMCSDCVIPSRILYTNSCITVNLWSRHRVYVGLTQVEYEQASLPCPYVGRSAPYLPLPACHICPSERAIGTRNGPSVRLLRAGKRLLRAHIFTTMCTHGILPLQWRCLVLRPGVV